MKFLTSVTILSLFLFGGEAQESCRTPTGEAGTCIIILECPALMNIYQGPQPIPGSLRDLLKKLQCGSVGIMPKVCCETPRQRVSTTVKPEVTASASLGPQLLSSAEVCRTPSEQKGTCVNIKDCVALMSILQGARPISPSSIELLRKSSCGFVGNTPKVCCEVPKLREASNVKPDVIRSAPLGPTPSPPDMTRHPNLRLLNEDICGPITQPKIFGGEKAGVIEFPWMALIAYDINNRKEFRCGGSIINMRYVLTAAHCVTQLPSEIKPIGVRVGEHDLSTERDCDKDEDGMEIVCGERYQDFGIEYIHSHPDYVKEKLHNDIALIRVDMEIDFRPINVRPICLPIGTAAILRSQRVAVSGWGATESGPRSQILLTVSLSPIAIEKCAAVYRRTQIWYKQICAGNEYGKDSCQGDSGGPLQAPAIYNNNARYVQYGIVSFGHKSCGTGGFPGVYTRVAYYVDWILDNIKS